MRPAACCFYTEGWGGLGHRKSAFLFFWPSGDADALNRASFFGAQVAPLLYCWFVGLVVVAACVKGGSQRRAGRVCSCGGRSCWRWCRSVQGQTFAPRGKGLIPKGTKKETPQWRYLWDWKGTKPLTRNGVRSKTTRKISWNLITNKKKREQIEENRSKSCCKTSK